VLRLSRKIGEEIVLTDSKGEILAVISVKEVEWGRACLGIVAPKDISICRPDATNNRIEPELVKHFKIDCGERVF
jgi:sRNA-binding carbon storage regulator CsrA